MADDGTATAQQPAPAAGHPTGAAPAPLPQQALAELVGTLAIVYASVLALLLAQQNMLAIALAYGFAVAAMVSATMHASGGHLNPAVTLGALASGRISVPRAGAYVLAQVVGGTLGALLVRASLPGEVILTSGIPAVHPQIGTGRGLLIEAIITFFLVFVMLGTVVDERFGGRIGGLAAGLTVAFGVLAAWPLTGASLNPVRWLGMALTLREFPGASVHAVGPLVGGILAGLVWVLGLGLPEPPGSGKPAATEEPEEPPAGAAGPAGPPEKPAALSDPPPASDQPPAGAQEAGTGGGAAREAGGTST